ncbi:MAG: alpha/beta hydrolase [Gammaproteobacteria bacterium]|nr:alpha/beta hydrolase [Gammaproteobacteria bacterium]
MRGQLAPHLQDFIDSVNQLILQAKNDGVVPTPEMAREKLAALSSLNTSVPDISYSEERMLVTDETSVPVRVYSANPNDSLPVVIYFHGGGHMCGDVELYDPMCRKIALASECHLISVDYRLSPEFPYPAGLEDAKAVVQNYQSVLSPLQSNERVIIAGDSAGGAICASLSMAKANGEELKIDQQVLIYPSLDYTLSQPSIEENGTGYFLEKPRIQWYFDNYFLNNEDRKLASPLFGTINEKIPNTLVVTAGYDPLRDEALAYSKLLQGAGVENQHHQFKHMIHAFMNIEDLVPNECAELFETIGQFIKQG